MGIECRAKLIPNIISRLSLSGEGPLTRRLRPPSGAASRVMWRESNINHSGRRYLRHKHRCCGGLCPGSSLGAVAVSRPLK